MGCVMKLGGFSSSAVFAALCLMTAGCGGGGGGEVAQTPPPPTSSAPTYDSFVGLNKNVTLATTSAATSYQYSTTSGLNAGSVARDAKGGYGEGNVSIAYDAASQTYTVRDGTNAMSYSAADKDPAAPGPAATPFDSFVRRDSSGRLVDRISAYRAGSANTAFPQLSYTSFVVARREASTTTSGVSNATIDARLVYAIGGFETVRSDLPKTGTASYASFVTGSALSGDREHAVGGTVSITADFGSASVKTALALTSEGQSIGNFDGVAAIESATSHFKGDLTAAGATKGNFSGSFFGPQAAEVGYTYRVQTSIGTVDGGAVGKK